MRPNGVSRWLGRQYLSLLLLASFDCLYVYHANLLMLAVKYTVGGFAFYGDRCQDCLVEDFTA